MVAKLDCTVVAKIDGKDPLYVISRLQEMLLDPEEPYVVAVHNGEHETSGNASGSRGTIRRCCVQW